ncbi:MAG: translation initiation factor IF-2 [Bacteroidaceae bacterium]|nr:translation initiation factor IF-2 [Bacteroidaceae bacterium]
MARLSKVTKELNVGLQTCVDFLQKKGYTVENSLNAKITDEQYELLVMQFSTDKDLRLKAEKAQRERLNSKKESKPTISVEEPQKEEAAPEKEEEKPSVAFKVVGKINLDTPAKKEAAPKVVETEVEAEEPVVAPQPVIEEAPVVEPVAAEPAVEVEAPVETKADDNNTQEETIAEEAPETAETEKESESEVFAVKRPEFVSKINVIGKVDLSAINQSTRPKKKSKEEKRKEREEQAAQRKQQVAATKAAAGADGKKKRTRIQNERVDINKAGAQVANDNRNGANNAKNAKGGNNNNNAGKGNDPHRAKFDRDKERAKRILDKAEMSEEEIQKQVKDTLARLTNKPKSTGAKHRKEKRNQAADRLQAQMAQEHADSKVLKLTEFVTANELASMMNVGVTQVIGTCMSIGMMVSINQRLDAETINIVAEEFGFTTEFVSAEVAEAISEEADREEDLLPRAPIVTVMGHVDHGKTSLLDYIRKANVIAGEAGGITQHIGAYNVKLEDGRHITFLDTPGHEAFTAMRARGAKVTDIAIIIVAADDDVMPQTKEAIHHAQAAGVPMVFAINKIDKPHADPEKIKGQLANMNLLVEDWGGKYQSQDISAKAGIGVEDLLEKVLLEAEMLDLKANPNKRATGSIIESTLDKGRGYVATVLVQNGTLKMGDIVLAGTHYGRVKAMFNERNQRIKEAGPAEPVLILGLNGAPQAGDAFHVIETEQEAREIANKREQLQREQGLRTQKMLTLDEVGRRIALGGFQELNVIVKGDVDGSIEALSDSLIKLSTEQIQVNVIHKAVGQISESDVTLASASQAIIIGFQVRPSQAARKYAETAGVDIRLYSIIYDALEEVKAAMEGMLAPTLKEEVTSTIEVREVFHISKVGYVAGAMVREGKVTRSDRARLIRDGIVIFTGDINALKRFKDDVKEVATNFECGISLVGCNDIKTGDIIETFKTIEVKQTL